MDEFISTSSNINVNAATLDEEIDGLFEPIKELSKRHKQAHHYLNTESQKIRVSREVVKNYAELYEALGGASDVEADTLEKLTAFVAGNKILSKEVKHEEEVTDLVWHWFTKIQSQHPDLNPLEEDK